MELNEEDDVEMDGTSNDDNEIVRNAGDIRETTNGNNFGDIRAPQIFHITLNNQLVPAREGGYLLADPHNFLYRFNRNNNGTKYYACRRLGCTGRCNVKYGTILTVTKGHSSECYPDVAAQELHRFKSKLFQECKVDCVSPFSKIYNRIAVRYPLVRDMLRLEDVTHSMVAARNRVVGRRIPKTMEEVAEAMEDIDYRQAYAFDNGTPPQLFFAGAHTSPDNRRFIAFRSSTIADAARGGRIVIEIDGTFSVVPNVGNASTTKFDNTNQLVMVHYRFRNRNYPIGYFLTSKLTQYSATEILRLVSQWLGPNTEVERVIADYEVSIRTASQTVWPNAAIQGCSVHYQRAVARWAHSHKAYLPNSDLNIVTAVRRAYALCYLPRDYIDMGIQVIHNDIGSNPFGRRFIEYLRSTWLYEDISVYGQVDRTTNGCESFHWLIQRHHDRINNNINQFISQLKDIESRCATAIRQFTKCIPNKKRITIENSHRHMAQTFQMHLSRMPTVDAVRRFLDANLHLADNIHNHFLSLNINKNPNNDGQELLIAQREIDYSNGKTLKKKKTKDVTIILTPTDPTQKERMFALKQACEVAVGRQRGRITPAKTNIVIADESVEFKHATICLATKDIIEIRDEGTISGTFVNGNRLSCSGVVSRCYQLKNADEIVFGRVKFRIEILTYESDVTSLGAGPPNETITVELLPIIGDTVPKRRITLTKNVIQSISRATQASPPLFTNTMFQHNRIGWKHAQLVWTGTAIKLKAKSYVYPTWVNGKVLLANEQTNLHDMDELIFGADLTTNHIKCVFRTDSQESSKQWPSIDITLFTIDGEYNFVVKHGESIMIGRVADAEMQQDKQLIVSNELLSRKHASVTYTEGGTVTITDLRSTNGTFVYNQPLQPHTPRILKGNEHLQFGTCDTGEGIPVRMSIHFNQPKCSSQQAIQPIRPSAANFSRPTTFITLNVNTRALLGQFRLSTVPDCQEENFLGQQWISAALATITKLCFAPPKAWTTEVINDILFNADDIHSDIRQHMLRHRHIPFNIAAVEVEDMKYLENNLPLYDTYFSFRITDEPIIAGNIRTIAVDQTSSVLPLWNGIEEFFRHYRMGILNVEHQSFAVFERDGSFYIFHPDCNCYSSEYAVLFESNNHRDFMGIISQLFHNDNLQYAIHAIEYVQMHQAGSSSGSL